MNTFLGSKGKENQQAPKESQVTSRTRAISFATNYYYRLPSIGKQAARRPQALLRPRYPKSYHGRLYAPPIYFGRPGGGAMIGSGAQEIHSPTTTLRDMLKTKDPIRGIIDRRNTPV